MKALPTRAPAAALAGRSILFAGLASSGHGGIQPCLWQQHRDLFGLRAAVGRRDGGSQHALRQNVLREVQKRLVRELGDRHPHLGVGGVDGCATAEHLLQRQAALELFEVRKKGLLDQPVGGAIYL